MADYKIGDLAFGKFYGYPLWPIRIVDITSSKRGKAAPVKLYQVFCYGSHENVVLKEAEILPYDENFSEASKKKARGVGNAFAELAAFPDVYKERTGVAGGTSQPSISSLVSTLVTAQEEIETIKSNMRDEIKKQVAEKCTGEKSSVKESDIDTIVSQIYDSISLEYSQKFTTIERMLKGFHSQICALETRVELIESRYDDHEQEKRSNILLVHGVSQTNGEPTTNAVLRVFNEMMGLSLQGSAIKCAERMRSRLSADATKTLPVIVTFDSNSQARAVFMNKKKLAKSEFFISEYLTPKRKLLLDTARDKFGAKNVWSDNGRVLARVQNSTSALKIRSLNDILINVPANP